VRFLLLVHLTLCLFTAALLNLIAWRYIHHFAPLLILMAAAVFVRAGRGLVKLAKQCPGWVLYARGLAGAALVTVVAVSSGMTIVPAEMDRCRVEAFAASHYRFPNLQAPTEFLRKNVGPDDIILCHHPYMVNLFWGDNSFWGDRHRHCDYMLQTIMRLPATLDDTDANVPLDRRDGTPMIANLDGMRSVFANAKGRIWYLSVATDDYANNSDVLDFLQEHTDVVFEDFGTTVAVADNHRAAVEAKKDLVIQEKSTGMDLPKPDETGHTSSKHGHSHGGPKP
jgi:hypothetical protein